MDNKTRAEELHFKLYKLGFFSTADGERVEIERVLDEACGDAWDDAFEKYSHCQCLRVDPQFTNPYKKNSGLGQAKGEVQEGALPSVSDPATEPTRVHSDVTSKQWFLNVDCEGRLLFHSEPVSSIFANDPPPGLYRLVAIESDHAESVTAECVSCEKKSGPGIGDVRVCTAGENPHQTQIETLEDNAELAVQEGGQQS